MPFTPVQTLIGAAMMGTAATDLLVLNGGVLGVSGFVHRTMLSIGHVTRKTLRIQRTEKDKLDNEPNPDPDQLALLSVAGLVAGGMILGLTRGRLDEEIGTQLVDIYTSAESGPWRIVGLAAAGILVGLGSKLANGCTSGHMLCGISRLSPRSLIATSTFFPIAIITHLLLGRLPEFKIELSPEPDVRMPSWQIILLFQLPILVYRLGGALLKGLVGERAARRLVSFTTALYFSLGLILTGMLRPSKVLNFLDLTPSAFRNGTWDPSLLLIIAGGLIPQLLIWQCCLGSYVHRFDSTPLFAHSWSVPLPTANWREGITVRLILGAALFGVGWGMSGVCPGPAMVLAGAGLGGDRRFEFLRRVFVWLSGFIVGGLVGALF